MSKQTKEAKEAKHFDVDVKVRDFCSKSKVFFIIGLALILISLLSTFTGVNVALEFKGGTIITYSYVGDVDENNISKELTSLVGSTVKVQQGDSLDSDTKTLSLSFTSNDGLTIDRQNDVTNKVKELCPDNEVTLLDANDVNARSGGEFFAKCIVAAVFAALILIIYIAFRFKQMLSTIRSLSTTVSVKTRHCCRESRSVIWSTSVTPSPCVEAFGLPLLHSVPCWWLPLWHW